MRKHLNLEGNHPQALAVLQFCGDKTEDTCDSGCVFLKAEVGSLCLPWPCELVGAHTAPRG